jgi:DNA polymerase-3 subunit delta'
MSAELTPLSHLLGQPSAGAALLALAARRDEPIAPLLFHGPEGVGKRTAALALCAALVCKQPEDGAPCGRCAHCARIIDAHEVTALRAGSTAGDTPRHLPDAAYIGIPEGKTRVSILQARDVVLSLTQKPYELPRRLYIIDPADSLTNAAANALLKVLEEPPLHAVLILIASAPWSLPITVRSRLTALRFRPLASEVVLSLLIARGMSAADAAPRAALSRGSISRALAVDPAAEQERLGLWCDALSRLAGGAAPAPIAVAMSEQLAKDADAARDGLEQLLDVLRDAAAARAGALPRVLGETQARELAPHAARLLGLHGERALLIERLRAELVIFNRNPRLTIEGAVLALAGVLRPHDLPAI